jgi:hypothetical protein
MYSAADYLEMIIIFGECERNAREAARAFEERFPGRNDNYLVATIKHQPLPHETEVRGPSKTKLESAIDLAY